MRYVLLIFLTAVLGACNPTEVIPPVSSDEPQANSADLTVKVLVCDQIPGQVCVPEPVEDALTALFESRDEAESDVSALISTQTNYIGESYFEELEAGTYYVRIACSYGEIVIETDVVAGKTNAVTVEY